MTEPAQSPTPAYVGIQPKKYKDYVLGLERVSVCWAELTALGEQEWQEVGDDERLGEFMPDFATSMRHEMAGNLGVVTVRRWDTFELVGYFVGVMGQPLKTRGKKVLNEVGVYLTKEVRAGWLASKLLSYVEAAAKHFGADALIISHRPEHARIGKVYQRRGFKPLAHDYIKEIG